MGTPPSPFLGVAGGIAREPCPGRRPEHPETDLHPLVERVALAPATPLGVSNAADVELRERPLRQPGAAASAPIPAVRRSRSTSGAISSISPGDPLDPTFGTTRDGYASLVEQHQVESLADADVDPQRAHGRTLRPALASEELQQVAPGQDAQRLARLRHDQHAGFVRARANAISTGSSHSTIGIGGAHRLGDVRL